MSANDDVDNITVTLATDVEADGDNSEVANNQESSSRDSNNSNEDGVMVNTDNNGSSGDSDGVVVEDAGREDMFMDAPEDLGVGDSSATFTEDQGSIDGEEDSSHVLQTRFHGLDNEMQNDYMVDEMERLRAMLDKTLNEKESIVQEHKDEMEMTAKGIANLRDQMRDLTNKQLLVNESQPGPHNNLYSDVDHVQLQEMIHECSMFLRSVVEDVQELNTKSTEAAVSREVVSCYMDSVQSESAEVQFQKDQYVDDVTNRMLNSFASIVYVEDLSDNTTTGKIAHVEKSLYVLIENYNWFLYQSDQLRQCLTDGRPDLAGQTDYGVIFAAANDELYSFRNKETDFAEKISNLEKENSELKEQLEKYKAVAETVNAELDRLKAELDQEKTRYSNTKEKLSLAVTKGKALVQQRDTLKQALAGKTSEVENCLLELKEKSDALEAAELIKEELVKTQISSAALQEVMSQKDLLLEKLDDILSQSGVPEGLRMSDLIEKTRWLVDERDGLKDVSLKFHQLADALLCIDLPEKFSFSDLESRLGWLTKSFDQAKADIGILQDEVSKTREALHQAKAEIATLRDQNVTLSETAQNEMEQLTSSLSMALVEKDCIESAMGDMSGKFEAIIQREREVLSEKEQMLEILLETSGVTVSDSQSYETANLAEKCLATLKERWSSSHELSEDKEEILQNLQSLLYIKDQDLVLRDKLLEEENQKMEKLHSDFRKASEEITTLKEQNDNLKRDLERTEDKSALIREKLTMAVKKGKGLVQEREGLKKLIDEKSSEIEKLKLELQERESTISDYESENRSLSAQVESMVKLEENLLVLKDQHDQLERDLLENNKLIDAVINSVNSISRPETSNFEQPLEKLKWLGEYLSECEAAKGQTEQQLKEAILELDVLNSKVSESQLSIKSLEAALVVADEKFSQLADEKTELEVARTSVEQHLQRAMTEASLFAEADVAKKALENTLAAAQSDLSRLVKEKEEAEVSHAAIEAELGKAKSESAGLIAELSEATTKVKALEDTVSHMETRLNILSDESSETQISRAKLEDDLKKFKEESDSWNDKLKAAHSSIKTLEEALAKAENDISELSNEKKATEQELSTLSAKLNACLEELTRTHGSSESRTLELFDHLKGLEQVVEDESLISSLRRYFDTKYESLKEMEGLLKNIRSQCAEIDPELQSASEEPSHLTKLLSTNLDDILAVGDVTSRVDAIGSDDISLYVQKIIESFHAKKKTLTEQVESFLSFVNESNASVLEELVSTSKLVAPMVPKMNSFSVKMKNMETDYFVLENKVTALEGDVSNLLSACTEATRVLELELNKQMPEIISTPEIEGENEPMFRESKHMIAINALLLASKKVSSVCDQLENSRNSLSSAKEELQSSLNAANVAANKAMEERDSYSNKVDVLEADLTTMKNQCSELRLKLENYQEIEAHLGDKNAEISSLESTLMTKEREVGEARLWASHVKSLLERANKIQVSVEASLTRDLEPQDSVQIDKLFYMIDIFPELQDQVESLTHENTKLQTALSAQIDETEQLKKQVQGSVGHELELEKLKGKIVDMEASLNRLIQMFSVKNIAEDQKLVDVNDLVQILEKLVMASILESKTWKSKAQELELEAEKSINTQQESAKLKGEIFNLEAGVQKIIKMLRSDDESWDKKPLASGDAIHVLEDLVTAVVLERETLKPKAQVPDAEPWKSNNEQELEEVKDELFIIEGDLKRIIQKLRGDATVDQKPVATKDLLQHIEKMIVELITETENSNSEIHELNSKLIVSHKMTNELSLKVKALEDSLRSKTSPPDSIQERSLFEAPSQPPTSEISEIEDVGSASKATISPVPSSTHVRTTWKGSSDHIALNIDSESTRLLDNEVAVEDKGPRFKSLNTSGLVPIQGKMIADRIDGLWVSGDRLLMSRPRARLGLLAYWLFLHLFLLGTIL